MPSIVFPRAPRQLFPATGDPPPPSWHLLCSRIQTDARPFSNYPSRQIFICSDRAPGTGPLQPSRAFVSTAHGAGSPRGSAHGVREDQEMSPSEYSCRHKQTRLVEFETGIPFDTPENAGAGNENPPEFCSLSKDFSMLLKDPWSWKDSSGFGVRSIAAIRKQSYILDYLHDSAVVKCTEEEVADQQVEEKNCLRGSLFEATDDLLWRPQSPLLSTEVLFSLDSIGSHDCTTLLQDESIVKGSSSYFRIWEQDDDLKDDENHADSVTFENESRVSDWNWGLPRNNLSFLNLLNFKAL